MRFLFRLLFIALIIGAVMLMRNTRLSAPGKQGAAREIPCAPGISYGVIAIGGRLMARKVHYVRVDPRRCEVQVLLARMIGLPVADAETYASRTKASVVINGGFFDEFTKPLGLVVVNRKVENPLHPGNWGVFLIGGSSLPHICHQRDYRHGRESYALQSGPRLVVNGRLTSLKEGKAFRSGVGVTPTGEVVLAATENVALSLTEFAELFARPVSRGGLGCLQALNLDGGPSTQFFVNLASIRLNIRGGWGVPSAIAVFLRKNDEQKAIASSRKRAQK